jgi:hypothetical protein
MTLAFKEWSYIVDALGTGRQSIILRKGGISEDSDEFKLKGKKFVLLPTLFHQGKDHVKEQWLPFLKPERYHKSPEEVRIDYYAEVADSRIITDYDQVKKLSQYHAWTDDIIDERFNRWNKSVHLLIVQVFELVKPVEIFMRQEYGGCKSWVELEENIELIGKPVLNKNII